MRAIEQLPEGIRYAEKELSCEIYGAIAVVEGELLVTMPLEDTSLEMLTRVTTIYKQDNDQWQAIHFHASFPSSEQAEGELWPMEALKAKNKELEKIVEERTAELKQSLENLKNTQNQLIHAEKMASLGELTAGIAHEIQNPLNFVNNFSDVNKEMLMEMKEEMSNNNMERALSIADEVIASEEKISHHGRRADAIVKGMLQHSKASSGQKEQTDMNALAAEYLQLAYHGFRAKHKSYVAELTTAFDGSLETIMISPQDIGRVLLNLYNNAFYATNEKKKLLKGTFGPAVCVTTAKKNGHVYVTVSDNGTGIPSSAKDKIFQPFYTTKPAGQGTGLGLSLSYDIIKAHGGEIRVTTKEGEGSAFSILLPAG